MFGTLAPRSNHDLSRPLDRLERDMQQLFGRFGRDGWLTGSPERYTPNVDVVESEDGYEVSVDLPGIRPEDFTVEMRDGSLWVSGRKEVEKEEKKRTYHWVERFQGEFRRVIPLPHAVDQDRIEANYEHGVLRITVPKAESARPKRIEIKS